MKKETLNNDRTVEELLIDAVNEMIVAIQSSLKD